MSGEEVLLAEAFFELELVYKIDVPKAYNKQA